MQYEIGYGEYRLGMLDKVEIHKSVELLADTATITLPGAQYNVALDVEKKLKRGDKVSIKLGYRETGLKTEFEARVQRISTDGGCVKLACADDLFLFRKPLKSEVLQKVTLKKLLEHVVEGCGLEMKVNCSYEWTYAKFVINNATGYDVLKKVQEECGADIYVQEGTLEVHAPGEKVGKERCYDFGLNVEREDLTYRKASEKKVEVVVKANMPDGTVREIETGTTGGEKVEVKCATSDEASMKARGELEVKRRSFDGFDGSFTGWLIPMCVPGDSVRLRDRDYEYKDGTYYVNAVTTELSAQGGKRKIELGFRLS